MAMDHAYNEIKGIEAYVGGHSGVSYNVEMDFESGLLTWRRFFVCGSIRTPRRGCGHFFAGYSGENDYYEKTIRKDTLANL